MHSVSNGANLRTDRRQATGLRISREAQRLTEEHGLDGFTMEDLADAAGVSRRTLFNYYPGKIDAVLGEEPVISEEAMARFRAGGTGDLVRDLRDLAIECLDGRDVTTEDVDRARRILLANSRLLTAAHVRFTGISAGIVELIREREGADFDAQRAEIAVRLLAALFDTALDSFLGDPSGRSIAEAYDDVLGAARQLLA